MGKSPKKHWKVMEIAQFPAKTLCTVHSGQAECRTLCLIASKGRFLYYIDTKISCIGDSNVHNCGYNHWAISPAGHHLRSAETVAGRGLHDRIRRAGRSDPSAGRRTIRLSGQGRAADHPDGRQRILPQGGRRQHHGAAADLHLPGPGRRRRRCPHRLHRCISGL